MSEVGRRRTAGLLARVVSHISLKQVLIHQRRLGLTVTALRLYQRLGVQWVLRKTGLLRLISGQLAELEGSLPQIPSRFFKARGQVVSPVGDRKKRVALLSGCVMPLVHGPEMEAVTRVLVRNGCEVVVPKAQGCCGAINSHVGDLDTARSLARRNIDVFLAADVDAIVVASAGCGSRMKEYGHLLRADADYADRAQRFDGMVEDIHEFLAGLPLDPPKASLDYKVTYQDSCHLANAQRVTEQPRALLRAIPGVELVELPGASICCGGGGTYTITERESSLRVLKSKMAAVKETGAEVLATANPGCVLQLQYGATRHETPVQVRYVTDLLDEAYQRETDP
jgi:glycolate oxidase iron-sulfur subunit